jgi:hypothetical protein
MDPDDGPDSSLSEEEIHDALADEVVDLAAEEPRSLVGKLFQASKGVVTSIAGTVKSWVVGEQPVVQGPQTFEEFAAEACG